MRLVLIAVVTLVIGGGILGFTLYQRSKPVDVPVAAGVREVADALGRQHRQAAADDGERFTVRGAEELEAQSGVWIGRRMVFGESLPRLEEEGAGLKLVGGGATEIPGPGNSVHILFVTEDGVPVSLFLKRYMGLPELTMGSAYTIASPGGLAPILAWRPGGQVYFIVSESPEGVEAVRLALEAPEASGTYPR